MHEMTKCLSWRRQTAPNKKTKKKAQGMNHKTIQGRADSDQSEKTNQIFPGSTILEHKNGGENLGGGGVWVWFPSRRKKTLIAKSKKKKPD